MAQSAACSVVLALIMTGAAPAQPVRRNVALPAAPPPTAVHGEEVIASTSVAVFGLYHAIESYRWMLTEPLADDADWISGVSALGDFDIELGTFVRYTLSRQDPADSYAIWEGVIFGPAGESEPVMGYYFEHAGVGRILPVLRAIDMDKAWEIHQILTGALAERKECDLDDRGEHQRQVNETLIQGCVDRGKRRSHSIAVTCGIVGGASCWVSLGAGCLAGFACEGGLLVDSWRFLQDVRTNANQANSCLCIDAQYRRDHPSEEPVSSDCATFECPDMPSPIPTISW